MTHHASRKATPAPMPTTRPAEAAPCEIPDLAKLLAQDRDVIAAEVRRQRDNSIGYLNAIAHKLLIARLSENLAVHGVTPAQWAALVVLWECDDIVQKDLAERMAIESATLTRTLDRMERDGFVQRRRDKRDRRRVRVRVTDKGLGLINLLVPDALATIGHATRGFSEAETRMMRLMFKRIIHNLDHRHAAGMDASGATLAEAGE